MSMSMLGIMAAGAPCIVVGAPNAAGVAGGALMRRLPLEFEAAFAGGVLAAGGAAGAAGIFSAGAA